MGWEKCSLLLYKKFLWKFLTLRAGVISDQFFETLFCHDVIHVHVKYTCRLDGQPLMVLMII